MKPTMEEELMAVMKGEPVDPVNVEDDKANNEDDNSAAVDPAAIPEQPKTDRARDETGKFTKAADKPKADDTQEIPALTTTVTAKLDPAPASWSAKAKAKWEALDPETRAEISKREADVHKMFTAHDGELNLGRKMKEVVTPYLPIIQAEGGTPETAVRDLLNTAYVLRTAQPMQKAQLVQQLITRYGIDMSLVGGQAEGGDTSQTIQALQNKIAQLEQQANPEIIYSRLQDRFENDKIQSEVNAFAADAKNVHYEKVRGEMAALLGSGQAKTLQEAYDRAIWANPEIRSTLLEAQRQEEQAKRKSELEAKKKAAVSVAGSPGSKQPNSNGKSEKSLEDDLREAMTARAAGL